MTVKRLLFVLALCIIAFQAPDALAANSPADSSFTIENLSFDARGSFHQEFAGGRGHEGIFSGDYFNLHVSGHVSPKLSYRIRQRLVKAAYNEHNIFNATDFLWLRWQASRKWALTFGKQPIYIGGYEYDATPIDVYYWSKFSSGLYKVYAFGITAEYSPAPGQSLMLQFCESPLSLVNTNTFAWNILWSGRLAPWWGTLWSANIIEDVEGGKMGYVALGNRYFLGPVTLDLDLMARSAREQESPLSDWSAICKIIWSLDSYWNLCTKFGHEENAPQNVDASGISYDRAFQAGSNFTYAGAGVEYFPLGNEQVRLHAAWYWNTDGFSRHNFDVGVTWRMKIL